MDKHREKLNKFFLDFNQWKSVPSKGWAEMIKKVYEIDPLICPECGVTMRIVSFIEDHKVIDKIIKHLNLTFKAARPPPKYITQS